MSDISKVKNANILLSDIEADPAFNSRDSAEFEGGDDSGDTRAELLSKSMADEGLRIPVIVMEQKVKGKPPYKLIAGYRRFNAAAKLGWQSIASLVHGPMNEVEQRNLNLIENESRKDLNTYDLACAVVKLDSLGQTSDVTANKIGKSPSYVRALVLALQASQPEIVERWRQESRQVTGTGVAHVCTMDNIRKINGADFYKIGDLNANKRKAQLEMFLGMLGAKDKKSAGELRAAWGMAPTKDIPETVDDGNGNQIPNPALKGPTVNTRPSPSKMEAALKLLKESLGRATATTEKQRHDAAISALKWAMGLAKDGIDGFFNQALIEDKQAADGGRKPGAGKKDGKDGATAPATA